MNTSVTDDLIALIVRELGVSSTQVNASTLIFDDGLNLDSFAVVDLVSRIESHFGFQLEDGDFMPENFVDIQTLANVVARYLGAKA